VAAQFPDKVISTLAYQYSRKAPKKLKPASNVNIMLCTIECDRRDDGNSFRIIKFEAFGFSFQRNLGHHVDEQLVKLSRS
jgi:hypothetical protein